MLPIKHENFRVLDFGVSEEKCFLAESALAATSSNMNIKLCRRNLFKQEVNLLKTLGSSVGVGSGIRRQVGNINW